MEDEDCEICYGCIGWDNEIVWANHIRAIYQTPSGLKLSGTTYDCFDGREQSFPVDEHATGDTLGTDLVSLAFHSDKSKEGHVVFHEVCWTLLVKRFPKGNIPWERLFEAFQLTPFPMKAILKNERDYGRGEQVFGVRPVYPDNIVPYDVLLCPLKPQPSASFPEGDGSQVGVSNDPFGNVPAEIKQAIAIYLPTSDVLSLRLASRWMTGIFDSQEFWVTRFQLHGNRGFLSYLTEGDGENTTKRDWRLLYHCTNPSNLCSELVQRKRVWARTCWLRERTTVEFMPSYPEIPQIDQDPFGPRWRITGGYMHYDNELPSVDLHPYGIPKAGAHLERVHHEAFLLPRNMTEIVVYMIEELGLTYITGVKFISSNQTLTMGYQFPGSAIIKDLDSLMGFETAICGEGIHALRTVSLSGARSSWIGKTEGAGITHILVRDHEIDAVDACFDSYKMIRLAVRSSHQIPRDIDQRSEIPWMDHLRRNVIWYPHIPDDSLYFNVESFSGDDPLIPGFRPIIWTLFGGPDGSELGSLSDIWIWLEEEYDIPYDFRFYYGDNLNPENLLTCETHRKFFEDGIGIQAIGIDGAGGGGRIESIKVAVQQEPDPLAARYIRGAVPKRYKFCTNHGNESWVPRLPRYSEPPEESSLKTLSIAPGATPVGLYVTKL